MRDERRARGGYTIVEVIIVLTVSALLFASSVVAYNQQNRRTQFTNSVNDFAQSIQDVLNDVENGLYPSLNDFSCTVSGAGKPQISNGANKQGTNTDCTFVGKAIQFAPQAETASDIEIYTIVGRRVNTLGDPVSDISQAQPVGLDKLVVKKSLISGIHVTAVKRVGGGGNYAGVAVVANSGSAGAITTGQGTRASIATVNGGLNSSHALFLNNISAIGTANINAAQNGIAICVAEGGVGGRHAVIELAAGTSQTIVNTRIDTPCP